MSTISAVGSTGNTWADLGSTRASARKDRMFEKADANGDGTVDATELQGMLDKISSKTGTSPASATDLMGKLDTDGNGSLGKDELADGIKSLMPPPASTVDFAQQRATDAGSSVDAATTVADGTTAPATDTAAPHKAAGHHHHHGHMAPPLPTDASTGSDASSSSSASQGSGLDTSVLTDLMMKQYTQAASNDAQNASVSLAA